MYPKLFGVPFLNTYGLMIAIGIIVCYFLLDKLCKKFGVDEKFTLFVEINGVASIIVGFVFAALFQSLYEFIENPSAGFKISGNITFFGGLIGGVLTFLIIYFIFRKKFKSKLIDVLTIVPPCIVIAHAFGRVGCFFAGCCYGKPTDSAFGVQFPNLTEKVLPTNLYEALFLFALFAVLFVLLVKFKFKYNLPLYCVCYGVFRFFIEYLRGDRRGSFVAGVSPSQFWSIIIFVVGIALWLFLYFVFYKSKEKILPKPIMATQADNVAVKEQEMSNNAKD